MTDYTSSVLVVAKATVLFPGKPTPSTLASVVVFFVVLRGGGCCWHCAHQASGGYGLWMARIVAAHRTVTPDTFVLGGSRLSFVTTVCSALLCPSFSTTTYNSNNTEKDEMNNRRYPIPD